MLFGKAHANGLPGRITSGVEPRIHLRQQSLVDDRERRADRNRHERLLSNGLATGLDATLIVAFAGSTETRFEQVVRGERREPRCQRACAAHQGADDSCPEIVVRHASRYPVEVGKRAHMSVEKADLILPLVNPCEVAARVHQAHQKEPRLPARPVNVDQHLEEVDLREIARAIRQRHEDFATLPFPFRDSVFDDRHADAVPLGQQQLVQPRGGQPLLAARPPHRFGQQCVHPIGHRVPDRPRPRRGLHFPTGGRLLQVFAYGDAR